MKLKQKLSSYKGYIINLLVPAIVFGFMTGTLTSLVVMLFKLCAKYIIHFSELGYAFLRQEPYYIPLVIVGIVGISYLIALIYKKIPNIKGGGIPTSVGILRGIITFKWLRTLIGVFLLSLTSFLLGVPLGNEGPAVQMGTTIGRGSAYTFARKRRAWDRYTMTGGACAGFAVATGAPISGILFSVEEAHQRISPNIVIMASSSVLFANISSKLLSPVFGISEGLFEIPALPTLGISSYWIPLVVGLAVGIFSVLFLYYYRLIDRVHDRILARVPHFIKIAVIILATLAMGIVSFSFISTGHEVILELFTPGTSVLLLIAILLVRTTLTLSANVSGLTGGTFIPILALGALVASLVGTLLVRAGVDSSLYTTILVLGITACISGSMKMPLTAIVFSIEALSCYENIIPVVITAFVAFLVTEMFGVKSINDTVIELREDYEEKGKKKYEADGFVVVCQGSFAVGKQVRDIFWPRNLFVLSIQHPASHEEVDEHGGREIKEGDTLHIRYSTCDEKATLEELFAIVGEQTDNLNHSVK